MSSPTLTITIPTFDRNEKLYHTLEQVLPQLQSENGSRCCVLVIDNASTVPVEETLAPLLSRFPGVPVEIRRNRANIGANANILRCFELCQTPYLWTLSDDDEVKSDAIDTIFSHIEAYPDCVFFNFGVEHSQPRSHTWLSRGELDFVRRMDNFGNTIFISSNVYRNDALLGSLKFAHHYTYTAVPQFVMVLKSLDENSVCCFSHHPIVALGVADMEHQWSRVVLALGVRTLLDMPMSPPVRRALALHLSNFENGFMQTRQLLNQLLESAASSRDWRGAMYFFDQIRHRRHGGAFYSDRRLRPRIESYLIRYLFCRPRLALRLISWNYRLKRLSVQREDLRSFSERL